VGIWYGVRNSGGGKRSSAWVMEGSNASTMATSIVVSRDAKGRYAVP